MRSISISISTIQDDGAGGFHCGTTAHEGGGGAGYCAAHIFREQEGDFI